MPKKTKQRIETAHCVMALNAAGDGAERTIPLLPVPSENGVVPGRDGRWWTISDPEAVLAASNAFVEKNGAPLDEGHKMFYEAGGAPAFGWFQSFTQNADGSIDGRCELNNLGMAAVDNKHYRYASVVFDYDLDTLDILVIKGAGLTNNQNLQVQALNSQQLPAGAGANQKEDSMLKALLAALGLKEDATQDEALNSIQELKTAQTALNARGEMVPKQQLLDAQTALNTAQTELKQLKDDGFKAKVTTALNSAVEAGKLTPAAREKWEASIIDEPALNNFESVMEVSPKLTPDQTTPDGDPPAGKTALNQAEQDLGAVFGNSEEDLKKYGA